MSTNGNGHKAIEEILSPEHLEMLRQGSCIADTVIQARGYRTIYTPDELIDLGFGDAKQRRTPGLLLPLHPTDGGEPPIYIYRPDSPRLFADKKTGKHTTIKYESPKGSGTRLDCPPICQDQLEDPTVSLWITEGQKKADALASVGLCAVALLGVWNWRGKNDVGGTTFLNDWDYIALNDRTVHIVFDSDVMVKPAVRQALDRLTEHLQRHGAHVGAIYLPHADGHKVGVDDWLAEGHTRTDLEGLVEAPRPEPQAAAPVFEILDEAPAIIRRPMVLIDDTGYAATWLHVRKTVRETLDEKTGEVIVFKEPKTITSQELYIVRDDGEIFGPGAKPFEELGMEIKLPEIPQSDKLWRSAAVKRYHAKAPPPDPITTFNKVVDIVDRFIDFNRSLADQRTMAEMIGCYILATWFLDAFNVIGFLWPNGDRGSGKTQLITIIAEMSYLGQVVLAGGSFAALRDLADYGALLAFDDAENLSDPKQTDPDKRTLLLAGNRRGAVVPLKELNGAKQWRTRYVDAYCPRCFSATRIPDPILASRTIVVPLIRTGNREKANADPKDYKEWPHERAKLIDDLWAMALCHLCHLSKYEGEVNQMAQLAGRNLEPWRPILAVSRWLDAQDTEGRLVREVELRDKNNENPEQKTVSKTLWERLSDLSVAYQNERIDLETSDLTVLILRALCHCAISAINRKTGLLEEQRMAHQAFEVTTAQVRSSFDVLAEEDEVDTSWMGEEPSRNRRIGRILGALRVQKAPRPGGKGSRKWRMRFDDLASALTAYSVPLSDELEEYLYGNGTNGTDGTNGTVSELAFEFAEPTEEIPF